MLSKVEQACSLGLSWKDAAYIESLGHDIKSRALAVLASKNEFYLRHSGSSPDSLFGRDDYKKVGDKRLLDIMAKCYDDNLETIPAKISRHLFLMESGGKSLKNIILKILGFPLMFFSSNATKQAAVKLLLIK